MDFYNAVMIARTEHEQMIRSLAPVPEYGSPMQNAQPGWLSRQAGQLLSALGNGLAGLGTRMKHGSELPLETYLREHEGSGVSG